MTKIEVELTEKELAAIESMQKSGESLSQVLKRLALAQVRKKDDIFSDFDAEFDKFEEI